MSIERFREHSGSRYFASPGYLKEVDPDVFQLFRSIEEEQLDRHGKPVREKLKEIPVGPPLREAKQGERVVLRSFHPVTNRELKLTPL